MAKKKIQAEVEEKGLDPTIPHSLLGPDKRLLVTLPTTSNGFQKINFATNNIAEEIIAESILKIDTQTVSNKQKNNSSSKSRGKKPQQ